MTRRHPKNQNPRRPGAAGAEFPSAGGLQVVTRPVMRHAVLVARNGAVVAVRRVCRQEAVVVVAGEFAVEKLVEVLPIRDHPLTVALHSEVPVGPVAPPEPEEAALAPVGAPAVAPDPVLHPARSLAPANDLHVVVDLLLRELIHVQEDPFVPGSHGGIVVVELRGRSNAADNGAPGKDLLHHGFLTGHDAPLGDLVPSVRPGSNGEASAAVGLAVVADVVGVALHVLRDIGLAGLIGHLVVEHPGQDVPRVSSGAPAVLAVEPLKITSGDWDAVDKVLPGDHNVWEGAAAEDLDPITDGCRSTMNPAA
eukprot:CAMPEP_0177614730 /NCGR_PEP_ID=MMETSP0419_2-20121207/22923_1 /TAXON_ID=582737 /ORGANISM="Tetraselmis sp., Strain GSL018" /LENGTH=308 /DNA_ID=CAMNT_0019112031 /DNA_START=56 /DNA_END=979 /DNA_ORIENTATION=+